MQAENTRPFKDRETRLPLYMALNVHNQIRSKMLFLNHFHKLSISVSYKCVIEMENSLASALCTRFKDDDASHLHKNLFTVGALDNTDHNLSSTTSFHGTGISIFQFLIVDNSGTCRDPIVIV